MLSRSQYVYTFFFQNQEIKLRENFNLSCRVVEFFEEEHGVAIWVEDGTRCPLITVSDEDIGPYDSQETQDINSDCFRICVRCSKLLLGNLNLERQMLLYLREVKPVVDPFPDITVVQFEIIGAIELLPLNTRYHISLMKRLAKVKVSIKDIEKNIQQTEKMDVQTQQPSNQEQQVDLQPRREDPSNKGPTATNTGEKNSVRIPPQSQIDDVVESSVEKTISQRKGSLFVIKVLLNIFC